MLTIKVDKNKLERVLTCIVSESKGLDAVITDDSDLKDWLHLLIKGMTSDDDAHTMSITLLASYVFISGNAEVIDAIQRNMSLKAV